MFPRVWTIRSPGRHVGRHLTGPAPAKTVRNPGNRSHLPASSLLRDRLCAFLKSICCLQDQLIIKVLGWCALRNKRTNVAAAMDNPYGINNLK